MNPDYLEFEQPITELEAKIDELRLVESDNEFNLNEEIEDRLLVSPAVTMPSTNLIYFVISVAVTVIASY